MTLQILCSFSYRTRIRNGRGFRLQCHKTPAASPTSGGLPDDPSGHAVRRVAGEGISELADGSKGSPTSGMGQGQTTTESYSGCQITPAVFGRSTSGSATFRLAGRATWRKPTGTLPRPPLLRRQIPGVAAAWWQSAHSHSGRPVQTGRQALPQQGTHWLAATPSVDRWQATPRRRLPCCGHSRTRAGWPESIASGICSWSLPFPP